MDGQNKTTASTVQSWPRTILGISTLGFFSNGFTPFGSGISTAIPVPANDDIGHPATDPILSWAPVLWLDLVEIEETVLLASNFDGDIESFRELCRNYGARDAEKTVNTIFMDQLLDTERYPEGALIELGTVVCKNLRARAARAFPGRTFVAELFATTDTGRIGVRLYQDDLLTEDR